jgi:hypothetical protein
MDPLLGSGTRIWDSSKNQPDVPDKVVSHQMIMASAEQMSGAHAVQVRLLTPTRLIEDGHLVRVFSLEAMLRRILRRLSDLQAELYAAPLDLDFAAILAAGAEAKVRDDGTHWVEAVSHSNRTGRSSPIGGLVGTVTIVGAFKKILPWLLWGEVIGVGKDVTKGNGWLRVEAVSPC